MPDRHRGSSPWTILLGKQLLHCLGIGTGRQRREPRTDRWGRGSSGVEQVYMSRMDGCPHNRPEKPQEEDCSILAEQKAESKGNLMRKVWCKRLPWNMYISPSTHNGFSILWTWEKGEKNQGVPDVVGMFTKMSIKVWNFVWILDLPCYEHLLTYLLQLGILVRGTLVNTP